MVGQSVVISSRVVVCIVLFNRHLHDHEYALMHEHLTGLKNKPQQKQTCNILKVVATASYIGNYLIIHY